MALLIYTVLRVLLVVAAGGLLYLVGMRGVLLVAAAVVVGALLSFLLLNGPRDRAAGTLQAFAEREPRAAEPDRDSLAEDAVLEENSSGEPEGETEDGATH